MFGFSPDEQKEYVIKTLSFFQRLFSERSEDILSHDVGIASFVNLQKSIENSSLSE